ncbi:MAG: ExbD/TolR family protein [Gemmatimonadaceae bacterium]
MGGRGYLIRFIDIGLIVMFGFIQISDIVEVTPVDLASPVAAASAPAEQTRRVLLVRIGADGAFAAEVSGRAFATGLTRVADLEAALRSGVAAAPEANVVVVIRPDEASVVQRTVDVMDVCDRLKVRCSLDVALERAGGGG